MSCVRSSAPTRPAHTESDETGTLSEHQPKDVAPLRAERETDAELVPALRHAVGHHAVEADHREQQGRAGE